MTSGNEDVDRADAAVVDEADADRAEADRADADRADADRVRAELAEHAEPDYATALQRFFRTGPGGYGEGDVFRGVRVPRIRAVARRHRDASLATLTDLLADPVHEHRFVALAVLDARARRAARSTDRAEQERLARFYLDHLSAVNNWDLVDGSAPHVLGAWLATTTAAGRPGDADAELAVEVLDRLVASSVQWHRRIAVLASWAFTRDDRPAWTLYVAERLADDPEDLIHKASGWMLREVGRGNPDLMLGFLDTHGARLARVTVRYALERMPAEVRARYVPPRRSAARG